MALAKVQEQVVQTVPQELQQQPLVLQDHLRPQEFRVQMVLVVHPLLQQVRQVRLKLRVQTAQMVQVVLRALLQE